MKVGTVTIFAHGPVLNRLSNHLNHTFNGTEKNKLKTSLNILLRRILTLELRNILLFKIKIQSKRRTMQIKIMKYDKTPTGMANIKNTNNTVLVTV